MLTVQLGTTHIIAQSLIIDSRSANTISSSGDILVKENTPSDVNVWDNEW